MSGGNIPKTPPNPNAKTDRNLRPRPNRVRKKIKAGLSIDPNNGFLSNVQTLIQDQNQPDTISGKTEYYGVCLSVIEKQNSAGERTIACRARIPEIHSHLPAPRQLDPNKLDYQVINLYPVYVLEGGSQSAAELVPGKILRLTHIDKNFTNTQYNNGRILEILDEKAGFGAGFNSITQECKDAFEKERRRLQGKAKTKGNKDKRGGKKLDKPAGGKSEQKTAEPAGRDPRCAPPKPVGPPPNRAQTDAECEAFAEAADRIAIALGHKKEEKTESEILAECQEKTNMAVYLGTEGAAFVRGKFIGNVSLTTITGQWPKQKGKYKICNGGLPGLPPGVSTYHAYVAMAAAAKKEGITLQIVSGFRTMEDQRDLKRRKPELASRPGYSNHQNGIAIDMDTRSAATYLWLTKNAVNFGFIRTVPWETWHWEFRPQSTRNQFRYVKRSYNLGVKPKPTHRRKTKIWKIGHWPAQVNDKKFRANYQTGSWVDKNFWQNDKVTNPTTEALRKKRAAQREAEKKKKVFDKALAQLKDQLRDRELELAGRKAPETPVTKGTLKLIIKNMKKAIKQLEEQGPTGQPPK